MSLQDAEYLKEATAQRKQEYDLAKVQADKEVKLAQITADNKADRRIKIWQPLMYCLTGILIVLSIFGTTMIGCSHDNQANIKKEQACVAAGKEWRGGSGANSVSELCAATVPTNK